MAGPHSPALLPLPVAALHPAPARALQHSLVSVSPPERIKAMEGARRCLPDMALPLPSNTLQLSELLPLTPKEGTALPSAQQRLRSEPSLPLRSRWQGWREPAAWPCTKPCLCCLLGNGLFQPNLLGFQLNLRGRRGEIMFCSVERTLITPRVNSI